MRDAQIKMERVDIKGNYKVKSNKKGTISMPACRSEPTT